VLKTCTLKKSSAIPSTRNSKPPVLSVSVSASIEKKV
jgi:hypothetical protein